MGQRQFKYEGMGPFGYLQEVIRHDMAQARAAGVTSEAQCRTAAVTDPPLPASEAFDMCLELLGDPDWRARTRAVRMLSCIAADWRQGEWLSRVYQLAFDDPDARVRGSAWLELAAAARDEGGVRDALAKLTVRAFAERFHARSCPEASLEFGARHWLWSLAQELERPRQERLAAEIRAAEMRRLAGAAGATIDSLPPREATELLSHPDAGYRLAALATLARTVRAPAAHTRLIERAAQAIGAATEAARVLGDPRVIESLPGDWRGAEGHAARIRCSISDDPDPRVRSAAVQALGFVHYASGDRSTERLLAGIALDTARPDHMRYMACEALAMVHGLPAAEWPSQRALKVSLQRLKALEPFYRYESAICIDWEAEVDWSLVEACAGG